MRPDQDNGYVFIDIPWRYSGLKAQFFGLDPLVLLALPLFIFGLRQGLGWAFKGFLIAFVVLFFYAAFKGYPSLAVFFHNRYIRLIGRGRWRTR